MSELLQADWAKLIDPLSAQATEIALSDASSDRRLPAIALLGISGGRRALDDLGELLDARQPSVVQLAALQALGQANDPAVGRLVVSHWKAMSPGVRREAAELLFSRRDRLEHLLGALESRTLAAAELDPDRLKQLRTHKDGQLRARAIRVIDNESLTARDRQATLKAFQVVLTLDGRPERGHAVFLKECATCHRALGEGVEVGPDLATVAGRTADDLLLHILDPNREVAPNYVNYNVATSDGRTISGIIASESATVADAEARPRRDGCGPSRPDRGGGVDRAIAHARGSGERGEASRSRRPDRISEVDRGHDRQPACAHGPVMSGCLAWHAFSIVSKWKKAGQLFCPAFMLFAVRQPVASKQVTEGRRFADHGLAAAALTGLAARTLEPSVR